MSRHVDFHRLEATRARVALQATDRDAAIWIRAEFERHFHGLLLDGLYIEGAADGPRWRRSRRWREEDVDGLVVRIAGPCETWFADQDFPAEGEESCDDELDDALPLIQSAAVAWRSAFHRQRRPCTGP